ncbi:MAG: T9SS type A sorting domain-containing protein [Bacteroidota bacterium]
MKKTNPLCENPHQTPRNHQNAKQLIIALILTTLFLPFVGKGQSTCNTAENDTPSTNTQEITRFCTSSSYWFTFIGDSTQNYKFYAYVKDSLTMHESPIISFYQGVCNSLNLISQDTMAVTFNNMATGVRYYVKTKFDRDTNEFNFFSSFTGKQIFTLCDSTPCDYLLNGNFDHMEPNLSTNPFNFPGMICRWRTIFTRYCSPQATNAMGAQDNGYAFMWTALTDTTDLSQLATNEMIFQNVYLPSGVYDVSMAYRRNEFSLIGCDHLLVKIMPNIVNPPNVITGNFLNADFNALDIQNVNNLDWDYATSEFTINQAGDFVLFALPFQTSKRNTATWVDIDNIHVTSKPTAQILTSYCKPVMSFRGVLDGCHTIDHVVWNFGDGTSNVITQGESICSHSFSVEGSYTVTATIFYRIYNSPAIASITQTRIITTAGLQNTLEILGNRNTCDSIATYSPINNLPGTICNWTIKPSTAGTIISSNNNTIIINWHDNAMTSGQPDTLVLNDGLCSTSINIWKCCKDSSGTATIFSDDTITTNINYGTYYLNGTITIDGSVTFSNAIFNMSPEAKILIKSPSTFNINYSTVKAGCNYMWDGIYNKSPHSNLNTQSSTIQDAQNAIVSENGGYVSASNTLFNLNNYGIKVLNSTVPSPLIVSNCKFYCTTDGTGVTPRNLIAPLTTFRGYAGINIENTTAVQVGDINKATKNKFSYTSFGVIIGNSNANIYNNNFINMPITNNGFGTGINVVGTTDATIKSVVIGGTNYSNNIYTNLFSNCNKGITQQNAANIKVLCDTFTTCAVSATEILFNKYRNIDFTKNRIQNSINGLLINDFMNTRLVVDSNSIYNVTNGLTANNATLQECYGATFRKNNITGTFKNGILLMNVKGRSIIPTGPPGYERQIPYIYANTITFGSYDIVGANFYTGIYIVYGDNTYIEDNIINTPTYTVASESQGLKLNGIFVIASPRTGLCNNIITNLGMGIRFNGLCSTSPIKSNSMNNNYYGVRLENATIGNQGNSSPSLRWVNRNSWTYPFVTGRYRVQGSVATTTTWTYDAGVSSTYTLLSNPAEYSVTGPFIAPAITNPLPQACASYDGVIWIPYVGGNSPIINNNEVNYSPLLENYILDTEENQYYQATDYYNNTQLDNLVLDAAESTSVPFNPIQTTSIRQFYKVNKLISENRIDEAIQENSNILPTNLIERNHQIANTIYLQSWAKGRFELTDDERTTLLQIATQPHIQGGYGVFTAWVMLNRVYRTESVKPKSIIKPFSTIASNGVSIYPNPAHEQVTINGATDVAYAMIYDLQGRELTKTTNVSGLSLLVLNTSKLTKGIYFITLINKDLSVITSEKLVIE